jgi:LysM repeat protein
MIDVALDPNTFSMRRPDDVIYKKYKLTSPTSDLDYTYTIPFDTNIASVAKSWNECKSIATQLISGKFTSTIGNRNSYLNVELTKRKFPNSSAIRKPDGWYYKMTNKLKIEDHTFGYLPENDGYKLNKIPKGDSNATTYTVKKGDSLWKIAFMFDTTAKKLANINGISVKTPLTIGQTIRLKHINT